MFNINCTKAAAEFFSKTRKGKKISPLEPAPHKTIDELVASVEGIPQWQWFVHAIKVKGGTVLIAMEYQTRFSITLTKLKKGDLLSFLKNLEHHLIVHVHELMTACGADELQIENSIDRYYSQHNGCAFYLRNDRSVQAHINDVAWHFRNWVDDIGEVPTEVELIGQDVFVNQLYRKRKACNNYFFPQHEFLDMWLRNYCDYSKQQIEENFKVQQETEKTELTSMFSFLTTNEHAEITPDAHKELSSNVISLDEYKKKL